MRTTHHTTPLIKHCSNKWKEWVHDADRFLETCRTMTPEGQLVDRKIKTIIVQSLLAPAALSIDEGCQHFTVLLRDTNTPEELCVGLGHEICHTFHFVLSQGKVRNRLSPRATWSKSMYNLCNEFAKRWVALHHQNEILCLITNQAQ